MPVRRALAVVAGAAARATLGLPVLPMAERPWADFAGESLVVKVLVAALGAMFAMPEAADFEGSLARADRSFLSSGHAVLRRDPIRKSRFAPLACLLVGRRERVAVPVRLGKKRFAEASWPGGALPCFRRGWFVRNRPAPKRESRLSSELWGQADRAALPFDFLIDLRYRPCHRTA